jgi:hypothetical protein
MPMEKATQDAIVAELFDLLSTSGRAPTDATGCGNLVQVIAAALPTSGFSAPDTAWQVIQAAVGKRDPAGSEHRPLLAAKHLLALGDYPDDVFGDTDTKWTLEAIARSKTRNRKPDIRAYSDLRREVAVLAGKYADQPTGRPLTKSKDKGKNLTSVATALEAAIEPLVAPARIMEFAVARDNLFGNAPQQPKRAIRKFLIPSVGIGALLLAGLLIVPGLSATARLSSAPLVQTKPIPNDPHFTNEAFWVPASAPVDTLPIAENYCDSTATSSADPGRALQSWLKKYGVPQYVPLRFTVRNVSSSPSLLGITHVVADGRSTPARTPGFIFDCPTGGSGGESDWAELRLDLASGKEATLVTTQPSDYFWYGLERGENFGIQIDLSGGKDFSGIITAKAAPVGSAARTVTLPVPTRGQKVQWHGIPANKLLTVAPGNDGQSFSCKYPGDPDGGPCDVKTIRTILRNLWGAEATK